MKKKETEYQKYKKQILKFKVLKEYMGTEEILERYVVAYGTGARISMPKKHIGKKTKVFVYRKSKEDRKK